MARPIARRTFILTPEAHGGVCPLEGRRDAWCSTGCEPSLTLTAQGRLPSGWVRLRIEMEVDPDAAVLGWLRADPGRGPEEVVSIPVPPPSHGRIERFLRLPERVEALRYDPLKGRGEFTLGRIAVQELGWAEVFVRRMLHFARGEGLNPLQALRAAAAHVRVYGIGGLWSWMTHYLDGEQPDFGYGPWARSYDTWTPQDIRALEAKAAALAYRPRFSVVMPVHNTPERWLRKAVESVQAQAYDNWELCICDDHSTKPHVWPQLEAFRKADPRIKTTRRSSGGNIARASNDAMGLMTGEYMCLMDHDDVLTRDALYEFASALNEDPSLDLVYSDEDRITIDDRPEAPIIKPAWSPEYLETHMYIGHLAGYRTRVAREIGGFREDFTGAQDYDLVLRFTERTQKVRHVPKVLYHWRSHPGSIAASIERKEYAVQAAARALGDRVLREGVAGSVAEDRVRGWFQVRRDVLGEPVVSIVLFGADAAAATPDQPAPSLEACAATLRASSSYERVEIIPVPAGEDHGRDTSGGGRAPPGGHPTGTPELASRLNAAAARARGDFLLFLGAEVQVFAEGWLERMLSLAQRPGMGAVGAKVLFGDRTLRHVGLTFVDGLPRPIRRGYPESDWGRNGSSAVARNYLAVSGSCMMVDRDLFQEAGGFDSLFAPELHAVDLCLRLIEGGRRVALAPAAVLVRTGGDDPELHPAGHRAERFRARWGHLTTPDPYYGANLALRPPTFEFEAPRAGR